MAQRASLWIAAAELTTIYMLSTLPTPLYVIYRQTFRFSEIILTMVYAAYVVGAILVAPVAILTWHSRETVRRSTQPIARALRPRFGVPRELWGRFSAPAVAAVATFAVLGFYSALIPGLLAQRLHNTNHAVAGAIVAELFLVGAIVIATLRQLPFRRGLILSLALLVPSVLALEAGNATGSMVLLVGATAIAGAATGLGYQYGLDEINAMAPGDRRSEIISTYMICCYVGISVPVIGVGILSRATSTLTADAIFGVVIIALVIVALFSAVRSPSRT